MTRTAIAVATVTLMLSACGNDASDTASTNCRTAAEARTGQTITVNTIRRAGDGHEVAVSFVRNGVTMAATCTTNQAGNVTNLGPFVPMMK